VSSGGTTGSPETRARILETALDLVTKKGAAETRIADIARDSGVSRQAVYLHFGTRAELFVAIVDYVDHKTNLYRHIQAIENSKTGLEALDAAIRLQCKHNPKVLAVADVLDAARLTEDAARAAWDDRMTHRRRGMGKIIQRLESEGLLDPSWSASHATDFLWSLLSIRVWRDLVVERGWSKKAYERHLRRVARAALLTGD
jgi:AcrR family transcriptional regulator